MMLHIDGAKLQWFGDDRWYDLIVILDDATSEIYHAQLVDQESSRSCMEGLREVIEKQGVFCALYSDGASHFFRTPKAVEPLETAFVPCCHPDLDRAFSIQSERTVNRDNTVKFNNLILQIDKQGWRGSMDGCRVIVYQHFDKTITIGYGPLQPGKYSADGEPLKPAKDLPGRLERKKTSPFFQFQQTGHLHWLLTGKLAVKIWGSESLPRINADENWNRNS